MVKRFCAAVLVVVLVVGLVPRRVEAYAYTQRQVFDLSASGLAKIAASEATIAKAMSILGILGRASSVVSVGFVAYEVTTGFWDWWNKDYSGSVGTSTPAVGQGEWGVTSLGWYAVSDVIVWQVTPNGAYFNATSFADWITIGQAWVSRVEWFGMQYDLHVYRIPRTGLLSTASTGAGSVPTGNRAAVLAEIDGAIADITVGTQPRTINGQSIASQASMANAVTELIAARDLISNGLVLDSGDYVGSPGAAGNPATEAKPGAVPTSVEDPPASDSSAVTSAVAAASAAITSAIAASQAAVVSAVGAVTSAVAASQAAVVSAVSAVSTAISASQAAVVSAVSAVVAPIVAAITGEQAAIVAAIGAIPAGGGAGTTAAVESAAAADVARDTAAQTEAAARPAPAVVCPVCVRADKWAESWDALRAAGMGAPVFGLINRIVLNPVGTIERVRTVTTSNFGVLSFDLNAWGIDTYIGVVRYVVIFVALMAGYFVIFG